MYSIYEIIRQFRSADLLKLHSVIDPSLESRKLVHTRTRLPVLPGTSASLDSVVLASRMSPDDFESMFAQSIRHSQKLWT